ncbi:transcriptional regulator [Mesorhizobium sp. 113-3-9]|uniref:ArsR/SmtB family transcription factor n=1 Tax=Mesorhizobium sp. 113-3-9 TaxID=2744517 RepID=UPI0019292DD9|nr:metalloregulator ArsR/SmtB family transcription factor [Mesorhizobium sp. 113-3-9]BCG90455.1 transcriptional regulator [Mesorhizobium sp. 113-3-9]
MISDNLLLNAKKAADFLAAVGNEKRLAILAYLLEGDTSVNVLVKKLEISQSALSQHLAKLRASGLVETRRDSQRIYYSCKSSAVRELFATLEVAYGKEGATKQKCPVLVAVP